MSYTDFEDRLLVACFLAAEQGQNDIIAIDDVINRFGLHTTELYIQRAVRGFFVSGYTGHSPWVGDPYDRRLEISAKGVREAERLVSLGVSPDERNVFVIFDEDADGIDDLRNAFSSIQRELANNNLVAAELGEMKEVIEIEIGTAERIVGGRKFNVEALKRFIGPVLKFLVEKFFGAALGELAKEALAKITFISRDSSNAKTH